MLGESWNIYPRLFRQAIEKKPTTSMQFLTKQVKHYVEEAMVERFVNKQKGKATYD